MRLHSRTSLAISRLHSRPAVLLALALLLFCAALLAAPAAPPVSASDTACVLAPQLDTPTPTPTLTPTGIPPCVDGYEPNETLPYAMNLTPGVYQPFICCRTPGLPPDVDWFRFPVIAGSIIQVSISDLPANYDLCLVAPDHTTVTYSTNPTTTAEYIEHVATQMGHYYAYIYGVLGDCDCVHRYTFGLSVSPAQPTPTPTATPTATPPSDLTLTGHVYAPAEHASARRNLLFTHGAGSPVPDAHVSVLVCVPRRFEATTDANGAYSLLLPGAYLVGCQQVTFEVSADGYEAWSEVLPVADLRANPVRDVTLTRVAQPTPSTFRLYLPVILN